MAYSPPPAGVEVMETHHSWVFLTDRFVYKMKKPIKHQHHDYSTLARRQANSRAELRLNRRLAKPIYLAVLALTVDEKGQLQLGGTGRIVDWLVKMRRIPAENMLDAAIRNQTFTTTEIDRAATKLATFYQRAAPENVGYNAQRNQLTAELDHTREVLHLPLFKLDTALVDHICHGLRQVLADEANLFRQRIAEKKIIQGHGDLRPQHVCLRPTPYFIDCLEFSQELRTLDPIDDLSYLALECDLLGVPEIGERFFQRYAEQNSPGVPATLKYFYKALRALVRARLAAAHLLDPQYQDDPRWVAKAKRYLQEAQINQANIRYGVS
ncbi:MAG: hypothetical protein DA408_12115 [Bacteroidetes bacterium]|nr:MAG: hypothetical protein C7N36_06075 [Bacteroidota bacterium]PTM12105.1 MAG: hypothetical protein DA408_12115 [Bacteroidota bacterium]